jgi:type I restriction enzyme S subunit
MEERELPVGWTRCLLGDVVDYGKTYKAEPSTIQDQAWVLELEDIEKDSSRLLERLSFAERKSKSTKNVFNTGDVLYGKLRPYLNKVIVADRQGFCSTEIIPLPPGEALEASYLFYWLKSPEFLAYTSEVSHGINMPRLGTEAGRNAPFVLAPLNEQRRIAAKLDTTLAAVEACRQRLEGVAAILKRFRQAVLAAATSGELTREWREERGGVSHWQEKGLAELGEFGRGRSRHRPRNDPRLYGGDYPFIQTGDVANAKGDWLAAHSQTYSNFGLAQSRIWPSSTLCITIAANIADTALLEYPACFPDSVVGFVADQAQVEPLFAKWMIDSVADKLESFAPATAQKNINLAILDQIVFSVPPLQEQTEIISRAQHLFTLADQLEARLTAARKVVDRLTQALLSKAFRGELVPQVPSDEPASELLARIRAARQAESGAGKSSGRGQKKAAALPDQLPLDAAPEPCDLLSGLLLECGALSERALLAASELDAARFRRQLQIEIEAGRISEAMEEGERVLVGFGKLGIVSNIS